MKKKGFGGETMFLMVAILVALIVGLMVVVGAEKPIREAGEESSSMAEGIFTIIRETADIEKGSDSSNGDSGGSDTDPNGPKTCDLADCITICECGEGCTCPTPCGNTNVNYGHSCDGADHNCAPPNICCIPPNTCDNPINQFGVGTYCLDGVCCSSSDCTGTYPNTCSDGEQNGDEQGTDCGGSCVIGTETSCSDGIDNDKDCDVDCDDGDCSESSDCGEGRCGNGQLDAGEACDKSAPKEDNPICFTNCREDCTCSMPDECITNSNCDCRNGVCEPEKGETYKNCHAECCELEPVPETKCRQGLVGQTVIANRYKCEIIEGYEQSQSGEWVFEKQCPTPECDAEEKDCLQS